MEHEGFVMLSEKKTPSIVYWLGNKLCLNVTNRCSNDCYYCFGRYKSGIRDFNLKLLKEPSPMEIIQQLQGIINRKHWSEIVFCGFGEPTERLDCVLEVTRWIKKHFMGTVRIDTNGHGCLLNPRRNVVKELKDAGVDGLSVSLNAHDEATYVHVCRPQFDDAFEKVLEFIRQASREVDTEITTVTIPEVAIHKVREIAGKMGVKFRIREYVPCFW